VGSNGAGKTTILRTISGLLVPSSGHGGEQQMLATARARMACPTLLMLDEPSWGLAPILVRRLFETIAQINRQGVTTLLVEQNVHRALSMAHRAYVLERGVLVMQGGGKDLLEHADLQASYLGL
jgi:branched-chain amino acid transport system ATP-binding protein